MRALVGTFSLILFYVANANANPIFLERNTINTLTGDDAKKLFEQNSVNSKTVTDYLGNARFYENVVNLNSNQNIDPENLDCLIHHNVIQHCLHQGKNYECTFLVEKNRDCKK
ncbi:MAG: hypothetical protein SGI74_10755 [Oligoflexia bacterium]|nr:hypothetical protein [Oligoflexia bacterium]